MDRDTDRLLEERRRDCTGVGQPSETDCLDRAWQDVRARLEPGIRPGRLGPARRVVGGRGCGIVESEAWLGRLFLDDEEPAVAVVELVVR